MGRLAELQVVTSLRNGVAAAVPVSPSDDRGRIAVASGDRHVFRVRYAIRRAIGELLAQPRNPYGYAKDALRRQLEFLQTVRPFDFAWARLFHMFGEGQPKSSLYPQLKEAVSRGDRIFNMSAGEQLRDYLHVEEIARLIVELATHRCNCGIVNVCSGKPISIRNLVEGWLREYGWELQLNLGHYSYIDYEPLASVLGGTSEIAEDS